MKILTVIVPTYNMEKYLDKCLNSLIVPDSNIMDKLEVLVVNDGSKDRSSVIAHGYEHKYPNTFRVIDKQNGNYGSCINTALPLATGKYVKVLDADDWFETENLSSYLFFLENNNSDLILTRTNAVNEDNRVIDEQFLIKTLKEGVVYKFEEIALSLGHSICMHNVTYSRRIFAYMNYAQIEGISYTDTQWIFEPMIRVYSVQFINIFLYNYLVGREGQTASAKSLTRSRSHQLHLAKVLLYKYYSIEADKCHKDYLELRLKDYFSWLYFITRFVESRADVQVFENDIFSLYPSSRSIVRFFENTEYLYLKSKWVNFCFLNVLKSMLSIGVTRSWYEIKTANWYGIIPSYKCLKYLDWFFSKLSH